MEQKVELKAVRLDIPEGSNIILGQSHFVKTVEDIFEAIVNTVPQMKFGIAFNEASGACLTRVDGNEDALMSVAARNATAVGAGHCFVVVLRDGFPINVLGRIKDVPEVVGLYCATANPVEVIVAETEQGRGILGVIDGSSPKGVEDAAGKEWRHGFLPQDWIQAMIIASEQELDELLSRPTKADAELMAKLDGPLVLLGAGGKMGPTLARRAVRAAEEAGVSRRVIAVSRYSTDDARKKLEQWGVETVSADLLDREQLALLPDAPNVIHLAARKFGSTGSEYLTWGMNAWLPGIVAERYRSARIVAMSSGNIYPFVPVSSGGATETTPLSPVGEYGQSALARERIFEFFSVRYGTPVVRVRLNYAVELRYGVLLDIGTAVFERRPVDLTMGSVNVIWQGDANSVVLRSLELCSSPAAVLNLTGPETLSVRYVAERFGEHFGVDPTFAGEEAPTALLNNASKCHRRFGYPSVTPDEVIEWTASWIGMGGATFGKPTKFAVRDGKF